MPQLEFCSFCNSPAPNHAGGAEFDGVTVSGKFCNETCFKTWLRWKYANELYRKKRTALTLGGIE